MWPYSALAERAWALRDNLTIYDAAYVALAELVGVPLVTLDAGLARGPDRSVRWLPMSPLEQACGSSCGYC